MNVDTLKDIAHNVQLVESVIESQTNSLIEIEKHVNVNIYETICYFMCCFATRVFVFGLKVL